MFHYNIACFTITLHVSPYYPPLQYCMFHYNQLLSTTIDHHGLSFNMISASLTIVDHNHPLSTQKNSYYRPILIIVHQC